MKSFSSFFVGVMAIVLGCGLSLFVVSKSMSRARAQGEAPSMNLPPPSDGALPPENPVPSAAKGDSAPPIESVPAPAPSSPSEAGGALDAGQDPGLKTLNPEGYVYDPSGRRDPFLPSKVPPSASEPESRPNAAVHAESPDSQDALGKGDPFLSYYLSDYHLVGILWDVRDPRAIVQTPDKQTLTFRLKMKVGRENAVIAAIREKEVVLVTPDDKGDYKKGEVRVIRMKN